MQRAVSLGTDRFSKYGYTFMDVGLTLVRNLLKLVVRRVGLDHKVDEL